MEKNAIKVRDFIMQPRPDYENYTPLTRWIVLAAVVLGAILEILDTTIVSTAIPQMQGNLGATLDEIGWVSTGYIVANVIVLPLTGCFGAFWAPSVSGGFDGVFYARGNCTPTRPPSTCESSKTPDLRRAGRSIP